MSSLVLPLPFHPLFLPEAKKPGVANVVKCTLLTLSPSTHRFPTLSCAPHHPPLPTRSFFLFFPLSPLLLRYLNPNCTFLLLFPSPPLILFTHIAHSFSLPFSIVLLLLFVALLLFFTRTRVVHCIYMYVYNGFMILR